MASTLTDRERAKADRRSALLREAARLFADRGFAGVSLEELGAAVDMSGPAVYRHFASKQALLGEILVAVSERLLAGGTAVLAEQGTPDDALRGLIRFHVAFALADSDVIRVQDRDLANLSDADRRRVRRLQNAYVDQWTGVLSRLHPERSAGELRIRAIACFGLINSTPHGLRGSGPHESARGVLESMALAALTA